MIVGVVKLVFHFAVVYLCIAVKHGKVRFEGHYDFLFRVYAAHDFGDVAVAEARGDKLLRCGDYVLYVEIGRFVKQRGNCLCAVLSALNEVCGVVHKFKSVHRPYNVKHALERVAVNFLFVFVIQRDAVFCGNFYHFGKILHHLFALVVCMEETEHTYFVRVQNVCEVTQTMNLFYLVFLKITVDVHLTHGRAETPHRNTCGDKAFVTIFRFLVGDVGNVFAVHVAKFHKVNIVERKPLYLVGNLFAVFVGKSAQFNHKNTPDISEM